MVIKRKEAAQINELPPWLKGDFPYYRNKRGSILSFDVVGRFITGCGINRWCGL
jgi:hypothetical protein